MFYLFIEARFAAFRPFATGSFRPTAPFLTPSAAYGLLLNLAGEEMRSEDDGSYPATTIKRNSLPKMEIALGVPTVQQPWKWGSERRLEMIFPQSQSLYQQLHNYPVGNQGKSHAPQTKGGKYNIAPVRRSFLCGLRAVAGFRNYQPDCIESLVSEGLQGNDKPRYGLPFLGDNNFLPDRIEILQKPPKCQWFVPITGEIEEKPPYSNVGRLTVTIDRADSSRTKTTLFGPVLKSAIPPENAWTLVDYSS